MNRNDRAVAAFTALGHGTLHGYELTIPIFVPIWLARFDASATLLGVVVGLGLGMVGLLAPIAGGLADRQGSNRLVLSSIAGMGVSFAALGLATSTLAVAVGLVAWGAAASLYHPAGLSLISRAADRRGTVLAYHGAGGNVGMVLGPLAAIGVIAVADWRTAALALAVPAAVCLAIGLALSFDENPSGIEGGTHPGTDDSAPSAGLRSTLLASAGRIRALFVGGFVLVFSIQLLYGSYYRGTITFLPDVLANLGLFDPVAIGGREIGSGQLAYTALLVLGVAGQYAGGLGSDRFSPERVLVATLAALVLATLSFVPATRVGGLAVLIACGVIGFFLFAFAPIGQSLVAEYVDAESHGLSFGLVYFGTFGVGAVGSALAGAALDAGGVSTLFAVLATLAGACTTLAVVLFVRTRRSRRIESTGRSEHDG